MCRQSPSPWFQLQSFVEKGWNTFMIDVLWNYLILQILGAKGQPPNKPSSTPWRMPSTPMTEWLAFVAWPSEWASQWASHAQQRVFGAHVAGLVIRSTKGNISIAFRFAKSLTKPTAVGSIVCGAPSVKSMGEAQWIHMTGSSFWADHVAWGNLSLNSGELRKLTRSDVQAILPILTSGCLLFRNV